MSELATQLAAALPRATVPSPTWVSTLRDRGARQFREFGLPTRKDEAWKYTGLGLLDQEGIRLATRVPGPLTQPPSAPPLADAEHRVTMLDGYMLECRGLMPNGLTVLPMAEALGREFAGLQELLESLPADTGSSQGFTALNTATLESGLLVYVSEGTDAGRLLLNWTTREHDKPLLVNARLCIVLERDAKLQLLEQFESPNTCASNVVIQTELAEGADLQHIRFQQETADTVLITRTEVTQQQKSRYNYYGFDLGGGLVRHDLHTNLKGSGAQAGINGAYLLDGNRHVDNHTRVDHLAPGGTSEQYFRGVAGGSGRAVFNTAVCVHKGADETEARQSNANILLSARAEVDTKPELEIYADEVIASHGATVGQLDEQAVFYLRSRGIGEQEARQLLTTAFCRSVSDKLPDPKLAELISQRMMDVMPREN